MAHISSDNTNTAMIAKPNTAWIWKTFWILSAITAFEFLIAFIKTPLHLPHILVVTVFVCLTIVKAAYIIMEFMHLGHEAKVLFWSILLPMIFVCWFLVAMFYEGGSVFVKRY